jgi:hypothetical protein
MCIDCYNRDFKKKKDEKKNKKKEDKKKEDKKKENKKKEEEDKKDEDKKDEDLLYKKVECKLCVKEHYVKFDNKEGGCGCILF